MAADRTCFVAMPIRKPGTEEHLHFRAIFNQMKPVIERHGYSVLRADDVQKTGPITRDVVTRLGESDLVIADLTDLNPNVFYELGVRHALRGKGTIMILDEKRTPEVPFDLSAYRVLKFVGELTGIDALCVALDKFLQQADQDADDISMRDNPVHAWFPMLPLNVLDSASESSEAPLRKTIKQLQDRLSQYEKAYGTDLPDKAAERSPLSAVVAAISDAEEGLLPTNVVSDAERAFERRDVVGFLTKIRVAIERNVRLPSTGFLALISRAAVLDLDDVVKALFDQALQFYPTDGNLTRSYLALLAHSEAPADRKRAREELPKLLSIDISDGEVTFQRPEQARHDLGLVGILLDAYQRDDLHREALAIAEKAFRTFPQRTEILRNYARALENVGEFQQAMSFYREAIFTEDVDDTSAVWLGNELHNQRKPRAAAEVYAFACLIDPSDAKNYAHLAEELSLCLSARGALLRATGNEEDLLRQIQSATVVEIANCAVSCTNMDAEAAERLRRALQRIEAQYPPGDEPMSNAARVACVEKVYGILKTELTTPGAPYDFGSQENAARSKD